MTDPLQLFNSYLDGKELSAAELRQLAVWIASDQHNAVAVTELAFIHEHIDSTLTIPHLLDEISETSDPAAQAAIAKAIRAMELEQPSLGVERALVARRENFTSRASLRLGLALASCLLIGAVGYWTLSAHSGSSRQAGPNDPLAVGGDRQIEPVEPSTVAPSIPVVAMISEALDAQWSSGALLHRGRQIRAGERLELLQGLLQLTTSAGSDVVVEAPATIVFDRQDQITLSAGKLTARVSAAAGGLTVETPTATVVDLGTEFGVWVGPDADTKVAVYDGLVRLTGRGTAETVAAMERLISAGRTGYVDPAGDLDWTVATLPHAREFVRPDEIVALREARLGSDEAQQQTSFYELQRVPGLVAYQGFDIPSYGAHYAIAFKGTPVRSLVTPTFARNLLRSRLHASGALHVAEEAPVFLDLDTSINSPLAKAGLLDERGLVGRSGTEVWLAWRARSTDPSIAGSYAGVSLMFGDTRLMQEPVFVGTSGDTNQLCLIANVGSRSLEQRLDMNPGMPDLNPIRVADQPQLWLMRVSFGERADKVAVWCDVPLEEVLTTSPHANITNANVVFDRLRLDVGRGAPTWEFDDFFLSTRIEAILEGMRLLERN